MTSQQLEATARDQCEGPFGPFLSDEERAEWEAFMSRPMTPAEFDAYDAWVSQCEAEANRQEPYCALCCAPLEGETYVHRRCANYEAAWEEAMGERLASEPEDEEEPGWVSELEGE